MRGLKTTASLKKEKKSANNYASYFV